MEGIHVDFGQTGWKQGWLGVFSMSVLFSES